MSRFSYDDHAEERFAERQIKKEWVRAAVEYPEVKMPAKGRKRVKVHKMIGKRPLRVVYKELKNDRVLVITAFWGDE